MHTEAVLLDIDGTLVDSNEQHVNAWAFAFREEGHPQEVDDIRAQIGKGGDLLVPALLSHVEDIPARRIAERHGVFFKELYLDSIRAFDGATELIETLHRAGCKVVLASSAKRAELEHYVDLLKVSRCLAAMTSIDDVESSKPEPDIFATALKKVSVAPDRALVVGDTIYDIEAAMRSGVAAIGLTSGPFDETQLKQAGAIAIFANVAELLRDLDRSPLAQ